METLVMYLVVVYLGLSIIGGVASFIFYGIMFNKLNKETKIVEDRYERENCIL